MLLIPQLNSASSVLMGSVAMILRQFLYFDEELIDDFLAQLGGGHYEEERQRSEDRRAVQGEAGERSGIQQVERSVRQIRSSKFERLYNALHSDLDEPVEEVDFADEASWGRFRRGQIVIAECRVSLPSFSKFLGAAESLEGLIPLMKMFDPDSVDDEAEEAIRGMSALGAIMGKDVVVVAGLAAAPEYRFTCRLKRRNILTTDDGDLEGEVTILGKLQRKLREGERELLLTMPGISTLNREQRRDLETQLRGDDDPAQAEDLSIGYPAAILTPIALYR
jgi:hypothetical protein